MNLSHKATRERFASFLDRLATDSSTPNEWEEFIVTHYRDAFLESMRRCVVRLMQNRLSVKANTDDARFTIRSWALAVRSEAENCSGSEIAFCITKSEAVVLDEFLRRYSDSDRLTIEHSAEQQALWNLHCVFEQDVSRPDWPMLDVARQELSPTYE